MAASGFLVPQEPISDPKARLTLHPIYIVQHAKFRQIVSEPIPQDVFDRVTSAVAKESLVANQDMLGETEGQEIDDIYRWKQTGDTIRFWWEKSAELAPEAPVTITSTSISSPYVSGTFYGTVIGDPELSDDGKKFEITIHVDGNWPVLIKGGDNIDQMSLFYLAGAATRLGLSDEFELLLAHAGMRGCALAASTLGYYYSQIGHNNEALYWFARFADISNQDLVLCVVARILMDTNALDDTFLAENLLIEVAKEGQKEALMMLGQMHLDRIRGFKGDPELAAKYFQYVADNFGDSGAMISLGKLYAIGAGVDRDIKKAVALFREAGLSDEQISEIANNEFAPFDVPEDDPDIVDITISAAIVSLVAAGCYFGVKLFQNWRRGR